MRPAFKAHGPGILSVLHQAAVMLMSARPLRNIIIVWTQPYQLEVLYRVNHPLSDLG